MIASTTQLNDVGADLAGMAGVHAVTDVTGFGLLGHLLEMCRSASLGAGVTFEQVPVFVGARTLAQEGIGTGAAKRNWASFSHEVDMAADAPDWQRGLLCDPQTSGGLLIACSAEAAPAVLELLAQRKFEHASIIGVFTSAELRVHVR
jgi:selenide,water dikinase